MVESGYSEDLKLTDP